MGIINALELYHSLRRDPCVVSVSSRSSSGWCSLPPEGREGKEFTSSALDLRDTGLCRPFSNPGRRVSLPPERNSFLLLTDATLESKSTLVVIAAYGKPKKQSTTFDSASNHLIH